MISNTLLSIVIPTYNRADFLDICLSKHIPLIRRFNIELFISDNDSTDSTKQIVEKWQLEYPFLQYHKNPANIGEMNFEIALKLPKTNYVWLLGDTAIFQEDSLKQIMHHLNNDYDMTIINSHHRVSTIPKQVFNDKNRLLIDLGWHMTQIASLIYSKKLLDKALFDRYHDTNFIQTGIIFETFASQKEISVLWLDQCYTDEIKLYGIKKLSWRPYTFDIWVERWSNFVLSLPPQYSLKNKLLTIHLHNEQTKLFNLKNLITLKSDGYYNYAILKQYKPLLPLAVKNFSIIRFYLVLLLPSFPLKVVVSFLRKLKS